MLELSDKLKKFSAEVLGQANEAGQKKLQAFLDKLVVEYDKKETEFLEESYHTIQNGLKQIDREKSSLLSKTLMDSRQQVLQKRTQIIDQVFDRVRQELLVFVQSPAYPGLLEKRIEKTLQVLGEGKKRIILTKEDMDGAGSMLAQFADVSFEVEARQAGGGMIGGCQGYHLDKNIFYDNSFAKQVAEARNRFLQEVARELKIEN